MTTKICRKQRSVLDLIDSAELGAVFASNVPRPRGRQRLVPLLAMTVASFLPAFAAAALMTGAVAHADAQDDQFLGLLSRDGINGGPPEQLIALAHERCDNDSLSRSQIFTFHFGAQPSPFSSAMLQLAAKLEGQGLTGPQVRPFLLDAIRVYCPGAHS